MRVALAETGRDLRKLIVMTNLIATLAALTKRSRAIIAVIGTVAVGTLVTSAMAASHQQQKLGRHYGRIGKSKLGAGRPMSRFAVLAHPSAHSASLENLPPGASLAATIGGSELFVFEPTQSEVPAPVFREGPVLCLLDRRGSGPGGYSGMACSPITKAEQQGIELDTGQTGGKAAVALLVPNGVSSVIGTDSNGVAQSIAVTNNVAASEDPNLVAVHYVVPGGASVTFDVTEAADGGSH